MRNALASRQFALPAALVDRSLMTKVNFVMKGGVAYKKP